MDRDNRDNRDSRTIANNIQKEPLTPEDRHLDNLLKIERRELITKVQETFTKIACPPCPFCGVGLIIKITDAFHEGVALLGTFELECCNKGCACAPGGEIVFEESVFYFGRGLEQFQKDVEDMNNGVKPKESWFRE